MIQAVVFDWAGTTVDYGCFAPVQAFMEAFAHHGIPVTTEETRKPMGMLKIDHIRTMLGMERIAQEWSKAYGRPSDEDDVQSVYAQFEPKLFSILNNFAAPKPYVLDAVSELRDMGLKIGSTTGYTNAMMDIVVPRAAEQGYAPDCVVTPDAVGGKGRPYPYMVFENLERLDVSAVKNAVKVGDTVSDIQEGKNAGVWTVGILEGSSVMGLSQNEFERMSAAEQNAACEQAKQIFSEAGADFILRNMSELPGLIRMLGV